MTWFALLISWAPKVSGAEVRSQPKTQWPWPWLLALEA